MALPKFEKDIANISKLPDQPNDVGGLTAAEFKAEFDKAGESIQEYINEELIPQIESDIEAAALGVGGGGSITTDKISAGAVTSPKIANGAVGTDKLADEAVTESKIGNSAVTTAKVANGAVTTAKVADKAITRNKLADEAVSSDKLFPGAVLQDKIAAGAVSLDKLAKNARSLVFENLTVPDYWWEEDDRFSIYPYAAKVNMPDTEIDASYTPDITFDENSESLAPIATTFDGGFYIYAASPPETLVKILTAEFTPVLAKAFTNEVFVSIAVTYAVGKELTCTDGTMTMKAKTKSGRWTFAIPYAGTWLISDGENEQSVSIVTQGQNVSVDLGDGKLWLFKDGDLCTDVTGGWSADGWSGDNFNFGACTIAEDRIQLYSVNNANRVIGPDNKIDFSGHEKLIIKANALSTYSDWGAFRADIFSEKGNYTALTKLVTAEPDGGYTGEVTLELNVASISEGYILLCTTGNAACQADVFQVYLT